MADMSALLFDPVRAARSSSPAPAIPPRLTAQWPRHGRYGATPGLFHAPAFLLQAGKGILPENGSGRTFSFSDSLDVAIFSLFEPGIRTR
jgi:hypothetical protein